MRSLCMGDPLFVSPFVNQIRIISISRTIMLEVNTF